jgi:hypothetical protein
MADDVAEEIVSGWVYKARTDLAAARKLADPPDPCLDAAVYHFEKTHDVAVLVQSALAVDSRFSPYLEVASSLTPFATAFRYPGEILDPTSEEFEKAFQDAHKPCDLVFSLIPTGLREKGASDV